MGARNEVGETKMTHKVLSISIARRKIAFKSFTAKSSTLMKMRYPLSFTN